MSLDTNLTNVIIEGNTIDYGTNTNGSSQFFYTYSTLFNTNADCKVLNNNFTGVTSNASSGYMIQLNNNSCILRGNIFNRGTSVLKYYINTSGSYDHYITENIFDTPTPDGTNELLVNGLSSTSTYKENKNQTAYIAVSKRNHIDYNLFNLNQVNLGAGDTINYVPYTVTQPDALEALNMFWSTSSTITFGDINLQSSFYLDNYLPNNVQVLSLVMGLFLSRGGQIYDGGAYTLQIQQTTSSQYSLTSLPGSLADALTLSGTTYGDNSASLLSATLNVVYSGGITVQEFGTATQYLTIDTSGFNYVTGKNYSMMVTYTSFTNASPGSPSSGYTVSIVESPILVRYRW